MADAEAPGPVRTCVICRRRLPKKELLRHVRRLDAEADAWTLTPDPRQTAAGRGWYCCSRPDCRERMAGYKAFRKTSRGRVHERKSSG